MDKRSAISLIRDTLENPFDKRKFAYLVSNMLDHIEAAPFIYRGNIIPDAYKPYISTLERIGKYKDREGNKIDLLIVQLKKETSLERARTMQRNFIAWYLNGSRGDILKDAALAAFVSPDTEDWRFSLVKMDYRLDTSGEKVKVKKELTPARRFSFLVGKNENSHTAQSCLLPVLEKKVQDPTLKEIEQAFDIETVTKEFFLKYRELFLHTKEELDRVVKKDPKIKADFDAKGVDTVNFAKKLLGQIIFLYFLQKKGWFGVGRDNDWGTGSKHFLRELFEKKHADYNNFFNDILEPLFYEALRTGEDRKHEDYYYSRFNCKIPFLNGGLFDPIGNYDWVHTDILIPDKLFSNNVKTKEGDTGTGILDVFDRYNFTVKEDEPLEKEVAIDPELLGKSYEKFNAIRPDNFDEFKKALKSGRKGEENKFNKKFGVYYTPREIVHYMCQQSLINYLHTEVIASKAKQSLIPSKEDIETLIHTGEQVSENEARVLSKGKETKTYPHQLPESIRKNAKLLDDKLAEITVCDPAVGSGAFPVGMMSEIVKIRNVLTPFLSLRGAQATCLRAGTHRQAKQSQFDDNRTVYNFKRQCIEHSLYGVDIDPGAVEIAKLRLWLSLVVDEEDIKNIKPLPNLDYKVVCGNSLLGVEKNLFNYKLFNELEKLKPIYFNETNPNRKQEYKKQIDKLISEITSGHKEFDFEVYFSEVFHHKGGFDVVIANPPYLGEKGNKELFQKIRGGCLGEFYQRRMDLFYFFFHLSLNIGKQKSNITFITTNYYPTATGAKTLRRDFFNRGALRVLINFNELRIFESALGQHNIITILSKDNDSSANVSSCITKRVGVATTEVLQEIMNWEDDETQYFSLPQAEIYDNKHEFYIRGIGISEMSNEFLFHPIFSKVNKNSELLGVICNLDQGIVSGADKVAKSIIKDYPELNLKINSGIFVLSEEEVNNLDLPYTDKKQFIKPFYKNSDINKWRVFPKQKLFILYIKDEGKSIKLPPSLNTHFEQYKKILIDKKKNCFKNKWLRNIVEPWLLRGNYFVLFYPRDKQIFENIKIVNSRRAKSNLFAIEEDGMYEQSDIVITTLKESFKTDYSLMYILCMLNSKLYYYWLYHKGKRKGETLELFQKPLSEVPIKKIPYEAQNPFITISEQILSITKNNDYLQNPQKQAKVKSLEAEIDQLVYKLYNLTPEEIKIVEKNAERR